MSTGGYVELAPPRGLAAALACVWSSHDGATRVLPDACVDVVFTSGRLIVAGPATAAHLTEPTPGQARCGVRFRVGAAGGALGLPAAELLDLDVGLEELWGRQGRRLEQRVAESTEPLSALLAGLGERLAAVRPDPLVRHAAALMLDGRRIDHVARTVALSERQLRRRFDHAVGYGPATLLRVQRFQRFLSLARQRPWVAPLARLAADAGYADQAHLTRECVRLSGLTPRALLADGADAAGEKAELFKLSPPLPATMAA